MEQKMLMKLAILRLGTNMKMNKLFLFLFDKSCYVHILCHTLTYCYELSQISLYANNFQDASLITNDIIYLNKQNKP